MLNASKPVLSAVVAMAQNRIIGRSNQLPWHMPADLKHFKALTTGHTIIMGRKTYESIGKPLPNRMNVILTRDKYYQASNCQVIHHFDEIIQLAANKQTQGDELFIIGGAQIYKHLMPQIQRIYLTLIHHEFSGDTYFPEIDKKSWNEIDRMTYLADSTNPYNYSFITLERS